MSSYLCSLNRKFLDNIPEKVTQTFLNMFHNSLILQIINKVENLVLISN